METDNGNSTHERLCEKLKNADDLRCSYTSIIWRYAYLSTPTCLIPDEC